MAKQPERANHPKVAQSEPQPLYSLVVIGASAGGIEALSTVLGTLAPNFPIPIVVAQHLDPRRPSHLADILGRRSVLPVRTITDHDALALGVVHLVPADRHIEITDGHMRLLSDTTPRPKPSINLLLSSAAVAYGERLIAVILTGTGSDGAAGAREVKAHGGTVIIENPETAAFPGMPASLAPTTVDLVVDLNGVGPLLIQLLAGAEIPSPTNAEATLQDNARERSLESVLAQVREQSGIDFSTYKRPTILRRIQRRMVATSVGDLTDYAQYLTRHPAERQRLVASFLIKVTEFFRDRELFDALRERVLPELITYARAHGNELRIWSAGCATGEEAYSLAILVAEALGDELERFHVHIFATDLDENAITFARRGVYPGVALTELSATLIARYFTKVDGNFEVNKNLRGMIIFGQHDLGQRPPFPNIDLVLCRNVLIYFTQELQARALQLFAFALRADGYLALGKAESARPLEAYFAPLQGSLKIYQRQGERVLGPIAGMTILKDFTLRVAASRPSAQASGGRSRPSNDHNAKADASRSGRSQLSHLLTSERARTTNEWLGNVMLGLHVGIVVVDRRYDIQTINSVALRMLGIYTAAQGEDLIHLVRTIPGDSLRVAIDAAFQSAQASTAEAAARRAYDGGTVVTVETVLGERRHLHITCFPYTGAKAGEGAEESAGRPGTETSVLASPSRAVDAMVVVIMIDDVSDTVAAQEREVASARRRRAEHESRQAHELGEQEHSIQVVQEENQRLKDEMERVTGINRSLLEANQDLTDTVLDLRSINEELLIGHEEAQASAEEVKTLNEELQATNEELVTVNEEMEATVEELHTANDDLQARGHELQQSAEALALQREVSEAARIRLEAILRSLSDAVLMVDRAGKPLLTNTAYAEMFGGAEANFACQDETGQPLPPEASPQQRAARGETFTMEFVIDRADGSRRWFEASGQPIRGDEPEFGGVVAIRDITERSLHRLEDEFVALASHELRTPLTPLGAYLELLRKMFADEPEDSRPRIYSERAWQQVVRLKRLVQDLLDLRRVQNGGFRLDTRRIALDQVVARTVTVAQTMTTEQTIKFTASDTPLVVEGDSMRLEQVLLNLLTNAITYAPQSERIDVSVQRSGNEAELRVQDYGPGIPAEALPRIFSRFYQVTSVNDRPSRRGLGLGLYIVSELVTAHAGRVEVTSVEAPADGHGTTFTIRLPLAPDIAQEQT